MDADWQLWLDWCEATGRVPAPTTVETIAAFVGQVRCGRALRHRRVRAVVHGCESAGWPVEAPPVDRLVRWGAVQPLLAVYSRWGWPGGLNGRRDAALAALWGHGHTRAGLRTLTAAAVRPVDGLWHVDGTLLYTDPDPSLCGACAVTGWLAVLGMVAFGGRGEAQRFLASPGNDDHSCTSEIGDRWRQAHQLFPAVDRHGWIDDTAPVSARTIADVLRRGRNLAADGFVPAVPAADSGVVAPVSGFVWEDALDELDARVDAIAARVEQVMRTVGQRPAGQ